MYKLRIFFGVMTIWCDEDFKKKLIYAWTDFTDFTFKLKKYEDPLQM